MSAHGLRIVCMDSEYHALKFESDQKLALSRKSHRHPNHARIELKHDDQRFYGVRVGMEHIEHVNIRLD